MALDTKKRPDSKAERSPEEYDDSFSKIIDNEFGYNPSSELNSREKSASKNSISNDGDSDDSSLNDLESSPTEGSIEKPTNNLASKISGGGKLDPKKLKELAVKIGKSRSPLGVIFSIFGITGVIFFLIFNPGSLLVGLSEMLMERNDSASTSMQRRILKVLDHVASNQSDHEVCAASKMRCHMGKFSNHALLRFEKAGIKPLWGGETRTLKKTGFPDKNPSSYEITQPDGSKQTIPADKLSAYLGDKENRAVARKVIGSGGILSMRFRAYSSAHMKKSFYNKFRLGKTGGHADGTKKRKTMAELSKSMMSKIPGVDAINGVGEKVQKKVGKHLGKAKKGGAAYIFAVAGCISLKAPKYIAAGVAAIQVQQLLPFVNDYVLSPGSKQKAHAFDSDITAEDIDGLGLALNEKYPVMDDDGNEKTDKGGKAVKASALESPYLLNALGVDDSGPLPSKAFSPAYSILSNDFYKAASIAEKKTSEACSYILSPVAMYTAMGVSAATTALASATLVGGLIKVAAEWIISEIIAEIAKQIMGEAAKAILQELAENDRLEGAKGRDLGDILGIGAAAYFSGAGMARGLPVLNRKQAIAFNDIKREEENLQREMDIAVLSPFDISSKHTFLGSIVYNTRFAMLKNRAYGDGISGMVSAIAHLPSAAMVPTAKADRMTDKYGGYAEYADLSAGTGNTDDDPCVNFALTPCVGITDEQAAMSTDEAIKLAEEGEWFNEEEELPEDADLFSVLQAEDDEGNAVGEGYIKAETPLSEYMYSCMDMSTGDYLLNTLGCMATPPDSGNLGSSEDQAQASSNQAGLCTNEEGGNTCSNLSSEEQIAAAEERALLARAPLLLDFQLLQTVNGFDDENRKLADNPGAGGDGVGGEPGAPSAGAGPISSAGWTWPLVVGVNPGPCYGKNVGSLGQHAGMDMNSTVANAPILAMKDGTVHQISSGGASGNMILVKTDDNIYYGVQHLNSVSVSKGQRVTAGQQIGTGGKTGRVFANDPVHLHITTARSAAIPSYGNLKDSFNPMDVLGGVPPPNGYKCY